MEGVPPVVARYVAGLEARDVDAIALTVAQDLAFVGATRKLSRPEFLAMLRALYAGFPDWRYEHDPPRADGDRVTIRWRQGGTHTGTFAFPGLEPVPPTGRAVRIPAQDFFYRVRGDAIVEIRPDPVPGGAPRGILEQIGVASPPL